MEVEGSRTQSSEKVEHDKEGEEVKEKEAPIIHPGAAIVPPAEQRAILDKLMPDLSAHYTDLYDLFGESLSSYLSHQGEQHSPFCDVFL